MGLRWGTDRKGEDEGHGVFELEFEGVLGLGYGSFGGEGKRGREGREGGVVGKRAGEEREGEIRFLSGLGFWGLGF